VQGIEPAETFVSKVKGATPPLDGRNRIEVGVEMRDPNNNDPDIGWLPATNLKIEGGKPPAQIGQLWRGTVTMTGALVPGKYRLIIQEFESHFEDGSRLRIGLWETAWCMPTPSICEVTTQHLR